MQNNIQEFQKRFIENFQSELDNHFLLIKQRDSEIIN